MSRRTAIPLVLFVVGAGALRAWCFTGLQIGDDIVYSRIAVSRLSGIPEVTNTQGARNGFMLPILASYALFGPGETSLVLYNVLCSSALAGAVFLLARRLFGDAAAAPAALVAAVHPNLVRYASECHTDTPVALWITVSVLVFLTALDLDPGARRRILSGLVLGWAYLHKETVVYMALFFAGHWWATGRSWRWYLPIALPVVGTVLLEMIGFWTMTGNPLERYAMIRRWHAGFYMSERYTTLGSILYRQFLELPVLLFTPWWGNRYMGLINLACLGAGAWSLAKKVPGAGVAAGWFLALYAGYSFWPSSLVPFLPGFFLFDWTLPALGAPLAVLFGSAATRLPPVAMALTAAGILAAAGVTLHTARNDGRPYSAGAREAGPWLRAHPNARVISDDKTIEGLDFFEGHRPSHLYIPFQEATDFAGSIVIVSKFWSQQGRWWSRPVPEPALHPPPSWKKLHESDLL
ncbi:MAG TPA: glycosyltransferase family 39 protein, partial [Planctomycetota bacterium]|nr:glycosyltransferase family 39 protein [Planctomycetota bacterium]